MAFILEGHFLAKHNILLLGESGCGKTWTLNYALDRYLKNSSHANFSLKSMFFYQNTQTVNMLRDLEM